MGLQQKYVAQSVQPGGKTFGSSHYPSRREVSVDAHGYLKLRHTAQYGSGEHLYMTRVKSRVYLAVPKLCST